MQNLTEKVKSEEKIKLRRLDSNTSFKLVIPDIILKKIKFTCKEIANQEWSGVIFYSHNHVDGVLVLTIEEIMLMDLGDPVFTSFTHNPRFAGFLADNPHLMALRQGLIHSHHNMGTGFSGTDDNTLLEGTEDYGVYLSLIVNNVGNYNAYLGVLVDQEVTITKTASKWFDRQPKKIQDTHDKETLINTFKATIVYGDTSVEEEYVNSVKELKEDESRHSFRNKPKQTFTGNTLHGVSPFRNTSQQSSIPFEENRRNGKETFIPKTKEVKPLEIPFNKDDDSEIEKVSKEVLMAAYTLSFLVKFDHTKDVKDNIKRVSTFVEKSPLVDYDYHIYDHLSNVLDWFKITNDDDISEVLVKVYNILVDLVNSGPTTHIDCLLAAVDRMLEDYKEDVYEDETVYTTLDESLNN